MFYAIYMATRPRGFALVLVPVYFIKHSVSCYIYYQKHMSRWSVLRGCNIVLLYIHLPYNYVKPLIVIHCTYDIHIRSTPHYQQLVYIALTTLQIRRLLLDDVESANVCIVRCSIYSCAPAIIHISRRSLTYTV